MESTLGRLNHTALATSTPNITVIAVLCPRWGGALSLVDLVLVPSSSSAESASPAD
jgi:hypothetical protein